MCRVQHLWCALSRLNSTQSTPSLTKRVEFFRLVCGAKSGPSFSRQACNSIRNLLKLCPSFSSRALFRPTVFFVRHFPVLHFSDSQIHSLSFSSPSFSRPTVFFVRHFPVLHFPDSQCSLSVIFTSVTFQTHSVLCLLFSRPPFSRPTVFFVRHFQTP